MIRTPRLELTLQTPQEVLAWVESLPPKVRSEISPEWLERVKNSTAPDPWTCMFRIRLLEERTEVGSCGFKGAPDKDGVVEIAYGIEEGFWNRGFATESANALKEYAMNVKEIKVVRAHTKQENIASERTLIKCGFLPVGVVDDPEDGMVNRWEVCVDENP
jgi:ribosomal-protein-alanine N-acetyltransferase